MSISTFDTTLVNGGAISDNGGGEFEYTPALNFNGPDTFTYIVSDDNGGTVTATVTITVNPLPDPPFAVNDSTSTLPNTLVQINVLTNDSEPEGDTLSIKSFINSSAHGTITDTRGGELQYIPESGFTGTDTFTYIIFDIDGATDKGTVTITVNSSGGSGGGCFISTLDD